MTKIVPMTMAAVVAVVVASASPATAATDDSRIVRTDPPGYCGAISFVDYGDGWPGGGNNDDYVEVWDLCPDHDGVKAWVWLDGTLLHEYYNPHGVDTRVLGDPFPNGDVKKGDYVGLKVCIVDGENDPTPSACNHLSFTSQDG
ncbi:hypothetical protein WEI85_31685 [Actinomycetes bacterium KLBMP 9797]